MFFKKNQKGFSLYLAVALITVLLAMVLSVSAILAKQLKIIGGLEDSVMALYAADSGIEQALTAIIHNRAVPGSSYNGTLDNGASYAVLVNCCGAGTGCVYAGASPLPCPLVSGIDVNCSANYYCVKSRGYFGPPSDRTKTQRALQVNL